MVDTYEYGGMVGKGMATGTAFRTICHWAAQSHKVFRLVEFYDYY